MTINDLHDGHYADDEGYAETSNGGRAGRPRRRRLSPSQRGRLTALTMHARHPDAAKRNGRKGGRKTAANYKDGAKVWATRMAYKRWHGVAFEYEDGGESSAESEQ